ncbi:MAG: hypothetical protein AAFV59_11585 [Pseudomonadota bacterium]
MNQEVLIDAIGSQLDALQSIISAAVVLALLSAWAGISKKPTVSVFSLEVTRSEAYLLLGWTFVFVNVAATLLFLRLADLILNIAPTHIDEALTVLATHSWVFNPYALFGTSSLAVIHSCFGYGALICIWWIGFTCLAVLQGSKSEFPKSLIAIVFLGVGLASMGAIQLGFFGVLEQLEHADPALRNAAYLTVIPRTVTTFIGIIIGGLIFSVTFRFAAN